MLPQTAAYGLNAAANGWPAEAYDPAYNIRVSRRCPPDDQGLTAI
jgi:hypothetical protein